MLDDSTREREDVLLDSSKLHVSDTSEKYTLSCGQIKMMLTQQINTHTHTHTCRYRHSYIHTHTHTHTYIYTYTHIHRLTQTQLYTHTHTYTDTDTAVDTCTFLGIQCHTVDSNIIS